MKNKLKGTVTITRVNSNMEEDLIAIEIVDSNSRSNIARVTMSMENFAKAVTGFGYQEVTIEQLIDDEGFSNIGKTRETKTVWIKKPEEFLWDVDMSVYVRKVLDEMNAETDGWKLWDDGVRSQQNENLHRVIMVRYV